MRATPRTQLVDHVAEELVVAALIRGYGDGMCVFLQRGVDDLVHRAVVAKMDDLCAHRLQDATHDVD